MNTLHHSFPYKYCEIAFRNIFVNPLRMKSFCHQFEWVILISKGWLAIAKLKPLSLFISLLSMPKKAFDNVKIEK